jgi:hypothetical protein
MWFQLPQQTGAVEGTFSWQRLKKMYEANVTERTEILP